MVMPRAFSSGALSIESNERNWIFGLCFCNTFVIAAVSVVLPWSIWPIVPTLTCGLERSNFCLAIVVLAPRYFRPATSGLLPRQLARLLAPHPSHDLFGDRLGNFLVRVELHGVR